MLVSSTNVLFRTYVHRLHQHLDGDVEFALPFLVAMDVFPGFTSSTTQVRRPITHDGTVLEVKVVHPMNIFASHVHDPVRNSTDSTELGARHHREWMQC
jgi:hypothetical protein